MDGIIRRTRHLRCCHGVVTALSTHRRTVFRLHTARVQMHMSCTTHCRNFAKWNPSLRHPVGHVRNSTKSKCSPSRLRSNQHQQHPKGFRQWKRLRRLPLNSRNLSSVDIQQSLLLNS